MSVAKHTATEDKYYVFDSPGVKQRSLHVVDADYGVFESQQKRKTTRISLSPKKFMNKFKTSFTQEMVKLPDSDDFSLRAEPEVVNLRESRDNNVSPYAQQSVFRKSALSQTPKNGVDLFPDSGSDTDSVLSSVDIEPVYSKKYYSSQSNSNYRQSKLDPHQDSSRSVPRYSTKYKEEQRQNSIELRQHDLHRTKLEMEYEKIKLRAARYQAERDAMRIRLKRKEVAENLREYEYYCVNGITHRKPNNSNAKHPYQIPFLSEESLPAYEKTNVGVRFTKQQHTLPQIPNETFSRISQKMPPALLDFLEAYADYLPTTEVVREFHKGVLAWISSLPLVSLIYPVLLTLGVLIPQNSTRPWSVRALFVGLLDIVVLFTSVWTLVNIVRFVWNFITCIYSVGRFLRVI